MSSKTTYEDALLKLGTNLTKHREAKKMTKRAVADKCGMEENNYARYENGETNPTLKSLVKICNALEIELVDLF